MTATTASKLSGSVLETIGSYNPHEVEDKNKIVVNTASYQSWIQKGAQPTDTIRKLVK